MDLFLDLSTSAYIKAICCVNCGNHGSKLYALKDWGLQRFSVSFILEIGVSQNLAKVGEEAYKTLGIRMGEQERKRVNCKL